MRVRVLLALLCLLSISLFTAPAQASRLVILPPGGEGAIDEATAEFLADVISDAALTLLPPNRWEIVSRQAVLAAQKEGRREMASCVGDCALVVGRLTSADIVVTGEIVSFGEKYGANLQAIEVTGGRLVSSATIIISSPETMMKQIELASKELFKGSLGANYFVNERSFALLEIDKIQEEAGANEGPAFLSFNSKPWAEIHIDGQLLGNTPIGRIAVEPGEHRIRFVCPTFDTEKTVRVNVAPGEKMRVIYTPEAAY